MKRSRINKYISLEASESESGDESEDLDQITEPLTISNYTDIAKKIEEKYSQYETYDEEKEVSDDTEDFEAEEGGELIQSQLIPRKSSPRLFLVRVKRGKEKEICLRILQNNPNICSIIAKEGLRGYLYIEAYQKQQVLDSFDKIRGINKNKLTVVPHNEMIEAISYRTDIQNVEFGRIKKGKYRGDLVQIIGNDGDMIKVRVMPRINNVKKLFDPMEYKDEVIKERKNVYIYKRDIYVNGYLEKEVLKSSIEFDIEPNFEELEQFNVRKKFDSDDKVKVTKGELIGLKGRIKSITGGMAVINSEGKQYEIFSNFLDKYYDVGEEVCYGSENGVVTNIKDNLYYIALKNFTEEVIAKIDQIKKPIPFSKEFIRKDHVKAVIKRDHLINKQVQIRKGQYKGYIGVVKDVYMNKCRIQISSNLKYVTVAKEDLLEVRNNNDGDIDLMPKKAFSSIVTKTPAYEPDVPINYNIEKSTERFDYRDEKFKGALISFNNKIYTVECTNGNNFITNDGVYSREEIKFVVPNKEDAVIIMEGEDGGKNAILLEINENTKNRIVKIVNGNIKNISLGMLTKRGF
jgi:transcription elongation factor SPT5